MKYDIKTKKLPKSETELEISLPAELLDSARKKALKDLCNSLEIDGFRKGFVPENIAVEKVGEGRLLEKAADVLLNEHFPKIIEQARLSSPEDSVNGGQEKLDIIGHPKVSITKLALGNPVEFKAVFAVMPEVTLPDYRAIAKSSVAGAKLEKNDPEASDKEIDDVLLQIRKNKAHFDWHKNHPDEKGHNHPDIKDEDLPPLDDNLAKEAGNFKDLTELKEKIKENIVTEKKSKNKDKLRASIIEKLINKSQIDLPEILIESETQKSLAQMKDDVVRMGGKFEDYLEQIKKTEEDLKKDLRENSEKKAKVQLIFNRIAETEKLEPNKEILENEIKEIKKHYPEASEENVRIFVTTTLLNQEVLKLLENQ